MTADTADSVLAEIFGGTLDLDDLRTKHPVLFPDLADIRALAEVMAAASREEDIQRLLTDRPQLLLGAFGYGQNTDLAFLTKPPIGTKHRADFAVLSYDQGGCDIYLIELESTAATLFTQAGTPAKTLQSAMGQVRDWDQWIQKNKLTFVRDTVSAAKDLPVYPNRSPNGSFLLTEPEFLEGAWAGFGGYDGAAIRYSILLGRWSKLSDSQRQRLLYLNRNDGLVHQIRTYDQLARRALLRPALRAY